jgi:uncharacterized protein (TIGR02996 family)
MHASETPFLRDLLSRPDDPDSRRRYAEWLDARGETRRAEFLRLDPRAWRLDCVRWLERDSEGDLSEYFRSFPGLRSIVEGYHALDPARERGRMLAQEIAPAWATFVESMGCPFEPFGFFDNGSVPVACEPGNLPFAEPIGVRGPVVTFASDFRGSDAYSDGLAEDLKFLATLDLEDCHYGAARCPVHPFIGRLDCHSARPTEAEILGALRPLKFDGFADGDDFRDQIHQNFLEQHIFPHPDEEVFEVVRVVVDGVESDDEEEEEEDEDESNRDVDETTGVHGALREYVGGELWYVLLHTRPVAHEAGGPAFPNDVILFAVGRSPHGDRLVGVVTHQACHNLCD